MLLSRRGQSCKWIYLVRNVQYEQLNHSFIHHSFCRMARFKLLSAIILSYIIGLLLLMLQAAFCYCFKHFILYWVV